MKYIEIDARYRVKIPDDYEYPTNNKRSHTGHTIEESRQYWDGKYITVTSNINESVFGYQTEAVDEQVNQYNNKYCIHFSWLSDLIEHCPQVKHYIETLKIKEPQSIYANTSFSWLRLIPGFKWTPSKPADDYTEEELRLTPLFSEIDARTVSSFSLATTRNAIREMWIEQMKGMWGKVHLELQQEKLEKEKYISPFTGKEK